MDILSAQWWDEDTLLRSQGDWWHIFFGGSWTCFWYVVTVKEVLPHNLNNLVTFRVRERLRFFNCCKHRPVFGEFVDKPIDREWFYTCSNRVGGLSKGMARWHTKEDEKQRCSKSRSKSAFHKRPHAANKWDPSQKWCRCFVVKDHLWLNRRHH